MNLEDVHLLGTRAAQPLAADVYAGTLYYVTDESVLEIRDASVAWVPYSPSGSGISELTGDITAGPGAGSQVATIGALKIQTGMIAAGAVTEAKQTLADNVTNDVSIAMHGYAPKAPNDATKYLNGVGAWAVPAGGGGGSDWDVTVVKSVDQDVENSVTLVDDTELLFPVLAGEVWTWELFLKYSGGPSGSSQDFKASFDESAGNGVGNWVVNGFGSTNVTNVSSLNLTNGTFNLGVQGSLTTYWVAHFKGLGIFDTNCNLVFKFAQVSAAVGVSARCAAGSLLRAKRIIA